MSREKQIKILAFALAVAIAVICTIMILGIQVNFNQEDEGVKITAPIATIGMVLILFVFKLIKKQNRVSFLTKYAEQRGKKFGPYFTIGFAYFDYMLYCGILSGLCGIISGILGRLDFVKMQNWAYGVGRMAIVFAVYVLCLLIFTIGNMIAFSQRDKVKEKVSEDEGA